MRELKKQLYMRWDELLVIFGVEAGLFVFGEVLVALIIYLDGADGTVFEIGVLCALAGPVLIMMFLGTNVMALCFNMGISMGSARRRLVPMISVMSYLECLAAAGIAYLLHHLELLIFRVFYPGLRNEMDMGFIFQWKYILAASLVIVAFQTLFGTLYLKFGQKALWIMWCIYMAIVIGGPRLIHWISHTRQTAFTQTGQAAWNFLSGITVNGVLIGLAGISVLVISISYFMLRKQQVTV